MATQQQWGIGDECFALYREDNTYYKAMVLEVTGDTYTVVFPDYGNHQPATPASLMAAEMPVENLVSSCSVAASAGRSDLRASEDQLAQFDRLIQSKMECEPPRVSRSKSTIMAENAPVPPPPPPAGGTEESFLARKNRLEMAKQLLEPEGASHATPAAPEEEEESETAGPYFGIELTDLYVRDGTAVPPVLREAAAELRKRAHTEGIFRIPGRAHTVAAMVDRVDKGEKIDLEKEETAEVASFLKKFFALLPSSVIPGDLVDRFGEQRSDARTMCSELRQLVEQALAPERAEVLNFTLSLLHDIMLQSDKNKMSSKNLATVFLPALFFSVQGEATSAEEIMKMAVLGKAVSSTLAFMIENPMLDPDNVNTNSAASAVAVITIPAGQSHSPGGPNAKQMNRSGSAIQRSHSNSPRLARRTSRRRSASDVPNNSNNVLSVSPDSQKGAKVSAESVLAAMRQAKDNITRRSGSFQVGDGSTYIGRRGWLTLGKRQLYFVIVNDWLYWFQKDLGNVSHNLVELSAVLATHVGCLYVARCNVVSPRPKELEVILPAAQNLLLACDSERECDSWLYALTEISIAGFPLPQHLNLCAKEGWVTFNESDRLYLKLAAYTLTLSRTESMDVTVRSVELDSATVAKGRTGWGSAGFVLSDCNEKMVLGTHNPGEAQEWVHAIKQTIVLAWCQKWEPERLPKARGLP